MTGPEVEALAPWFEAGLNVHVAGSLFDVSAFGPDIGVPVPRIVRALIDVADAGRRDDHFSLGRRSHADFHRDTGCLRHTTGTIQANAGMDAWRLSKLMGHASMSNTVRYVTMSPEPLEDAWRGKR